jgi:putative membrane protein (TIGR04086 family)
MNRRAIVVGVVTGLGITVLGTLACTWWIFTVWVPEMYVGSYMHSLIIVSVIVGGMTTGWLGGRYGWKHGGWSGLIYFAFWFFGVLFLAPVFFTWHDFAAQLLLLTGLGAMSGVLGLNLRRVSRRRRAQKGTMAGSSG